jgi:histidinol phosphatase-like PHP family hydrolase
MNNWTNYHTHSGYCDGKDSIEEIIKKRKKIKEAGSIVEVKRQSK